MANVATLGLEISVAVVVAVGFAIAVYALVSFMLMRHHVAERDVAASLRAFAEEVWIAARTQPLLPLFYFVGRRMKSAKRGRVPIIFVHGYMQNRVGFVRLARELARRGFGPLFGFNYPWVVSIPSNARRLERFIRRVCEETGSDAVDLVCHSMGGIVAVEMMRNPSSELRVRRCVSIATPHAGVLWRGPLLGLGATSLRRGSALLSEHAAVPVAVPFLSIYSTHDNVVHPKESSSLAGRGGQDVEIQGVAHLSILFAQEVVDQVSAFLEAPESDAEREARRSTSAVAAHDASQA
jgi:pimeloyl-ACP methyl ester carboxylesterase